MMCWPTLELMLDNYLRKIKDAILIPVARFAGQYASPNIISLSAGGVGAVCGIMAWQGMYTPALVLWLLNRLLDGLDGAVARLYDRQTDLGGYLDILIDFVIYAAIPVSLAIGRDMTTTFAAALFLLSTFYVNAASWLYLSSLLERHRMQPENIRLTSVVIPAGLIEGAETIIFFALFFLFPGWIDALFVLMGVLVCVTIIQRFWWASHYLNRRH